MNIKTVVIHATERAQRLVHAILGVRAVSVAPAAAQRQTAATLVPWRVVDTDEHAVRVAP